MWTDRLVLGLLASLAALGSAPRLTAAPPKKLNVLYVVADDLRTDLGCYGGPAKTPTLDALARRGVRFTAAYCQQALCNPSRSSFLTGKRPDDLHLWHNGTHFREKNPDVITLPQWFQAQGYVTRDVGKIFHNWHTKEKGDRRSWSADEFLHYANHGDDLPKVTGEPPPNTAGTFDRTYGASPLCERLNVPDEAYYDGRVAAEAVRVLSEIKDKPFFLAVGFWKPHAPFNAPKKYWDLYDRAALPPLDPARPQGAPELAFHDSREIRGIPPKQVTFTADQAAAIRHGYLANISYLDAQLAKVLAALDEHKLTENTLIVFHSDHGYHLGEHGLWAKTSNFERDARVPLVLVPPKCDQAGKAAAGPVELLDLFPTVCELAGVKPPPGLAGMSLAPTLADATKVVKETAFTQHPRPAYFDRTEKGVPDAMGYSVRTPAARYTEWRDWETGKVLVAELYDHRETNNRLDDPPSVEAFDAAKAALHKQFPPGYAAVAALTPLERIMRTTWAVLALLAVAADRPPNVVLIVADDMGYADAGCYGAKDVRTPNLDRMAKEGTRFTSYCAAQSVCTASRAALLSGCYPNRIGMAGALNHTSPTGIHPDETLLPELLKAKGYATAHYGKWHLGTRPAFFPTRNGFDDWVGLPYSNDNGPLHPTVRGIPALPLYANDEVIARDPDQSEFTKRFTEKAVGFIKANQAKPFFLYVPHVMPHVPIFASERFRGKSGRGLYGDAIEELDWSVGEILQAVKDSGLEANTLVLFLSDNGPFLSYGSHAGSAGPLREGKLTTFEGGVRVPFLARWPGKVPVGRVSDELITGLDLLPTIAKLVGSELPTARIDGADLSSLLLGKDGVTGRPSFAYYSGSELHAVRSGRWKLHLPHDYLTVDGPPGKDGKPANHAKMKASAIEQSGIRGIASRHGYRVERIGLSLFDLSADPGESRNVADEHPDVVKQLAGLADEFRRDLGDPLTGMKGNGLRPPGRDETVPKR